jgi:hypothetical protein
MVNKAITTTTPTTPTTPTIGEKIYKGFSFHNITFDINNGISGIITLDGFDYNIKNNEIKGDGVVSQQSSQESAQKNIPVKDTKAIEIENAFDQQLQGTGIRVQIVP